MDKQIATPDLTIVVFSYDPVTKEFKGEVSSRLSPVDYKLGNLVPMIPANCLLVEPPICGPEEVAVVGPDNKTWVKAKDLRGTITYDDFGNPVAINTIGEEPRTGPDPTIRKPKWNGSGWDETLPVDEVKRLAELELVVLSMRLEYAKTLNLSLAEETLQIQKDAKAAELSKLEVKPIIEEIQK